MILSNLNHFKNGWVIGDFTPSLLSTKDFEVSIQSHPKGFIGQKHYHKESTEYNVIVKGRVNICGKELKEGDIFVFPPNEVSESEFLEDTTIVVVRTPSLPKDKYMWAINIPPFRKPVDEYILFDLLKGKKQGTIVEVGAASAEKGSVSKIFRETGWRAICIEPVEKFIKKHKAMGNEIYQVAVSDHDDPSGSFQVSYIQDNVDEDTHPWAAINITNPRMELEKTKRSADDIKKVYDRCVTIPMEIVTLNTLFSRIGLNNLDVLSIDVEGWELQVLKGCDFNKYTPSVILIENVLHDPMYNEYLAKFNYTRIDLGEDEMYIKNV